MTRFSTLVSKVPRWAYAIAIMSAIVLVFLWLSIDPKSATIRGTVENSETGKPVADAKVIATLWHDKSFGKSHPHKFGTKTTAEGRFRFSVKPGFGISRIDIGAVMKSQTAGRTHPRNR